MKNFLSLCLSFAFAATAGAQSSVTLAPRPNNPNQFEPRTGNIKSGVLLTNFDAQATSGNSLKFRNAAGTQTMSYDEDGRITLMRVPSGAALLVNTNVLVVATNYVGIGTATPLRPLHVGNYNAAGRADTKILVSAEMNNANGSGSSHGFADASLISRSGGIGYNSFDANANIGGGVDYDHYAAFQSSPANVSVGVMNDYFGHYDVFNIQGGVLKNDYGFYKATGALYNGARVTNIYGIYIAPQTNGTAKNYGVYVAANSNYFGGRLDIAGHVVPSADGTYNSGSDGSRWFNTYSYNFIGSSFNGSTVKANTFKDASFGEVTAFTFDGTLTKFAIPLNLAATAEPAAPAAGITLFVVNDGGKMVLKCKAPGGDVGTLYTEP